MELASCKDHYRGLRRGNRFIWKSDLCLLWGHVSLKVFKSSLVWHPSLWQTQLFKIQLMTIRGNKMEVASLHKI